MKKCFILTIFASVFITLFSSCQSMINAFTVDYSVPVTEDYETVKTKADKTVVQKDYLKRFNTTDKVGKSHAVIILDKKYLSIDGELFAYKFDNIMYYGPELSIGKTTVYTLQDKMQGIQGYASCVRFPDITISFIFSKQIFGQPGFSSQYEAIKINGVSFSVPPSGPGYGYIDDFGNWQNYTYYDYFEQIFGTRKQDVSMKLYQAVELQNKKSTGNN